MNFINDLETNRHCSQFLTLTVNFRNVIHDFFRIITILIYRLSSRFACHCLLPLKTPPEFIPVQYCSLPNYSFPTFSAKLFYQAAILLFFSFASCQDFSARVFQTELRNWSVVWKKLFTLFIKRRFAHCVSPENTSCFFQRHFASYNRPKNAVLLLNCYREP